MRIKIVADVGDGLTLPINYNHLLAGVIYRFLAKSDPEYASFLHNEGYLAAEKQFKLFTFSQLMVEHRRIKGIKIRGVLCPFRVSGSVPLIQIGYECGFGDKNSADFGMVKT